MYFWTSNLVVISHKQLRTPFPFLPFTFFLFFLFFLVFKPSSNFGLWVQPFSPALPTFSENIASTFIPTKQICMIIIFCKRGKILACNRVNILHCLTVSRICSLKSSSTWGLTSVVQVYVTRASVAKRLKLYPDPINGQDPFGCSRTDITQQDLNWYQVVVVYTSRASNFENLGLYLKFNHLKSKKCYYGLWLKILIKAIVS